ncbi:MAG TPA: hypothetical protein ENG74_03965, partial [Thermoplasmatales archaeon]|nr:hypothetical protein [Thermoplasmatales archaeon]
MGWEIISNNRATSYPLQSIMAISIVVTLIAFYFITVNNTFVNYETNDVDLSAKAIDIAERLLSDPGQKIDLSMEWEKDPENVSVLGLGARQVYHTPRTVTFPNQVYGETYHGISELKGKNDDFSIIGRFHVNESSSCFLAGTKIEMADGTTKNIEDIQVGDRVKSYDEKTGEWKVGVVTKVFHHSPEEMGDYYLVINNELRVTPNHPILVNGKWIKAGEIKIGDRLSNGLIATSIARVYTKVETYN